MGTTYSNCQVHSDSQEAVIEALRGLLKEPAYVAPAVGGWVGVYPEGYSSAAENIARKLSSKLSCGVFYWSVHDSDVFFYTLYESGKKRDEFDSNPDYFETVSKAAKARLRGKPEALVPYCLPGIGYAQVQEVLHPPLLNEEEAMPAPGNYMLSEKNLQLFSRLLSTTLEEMKAGIAQKRLERYTSAEEQAEDLAKLLGIPEDLQWTEYRDIAEANGKFQDRQFNLAGNDNLSQEYKNGKLWASFRAESLEAAVEMGADVNARNKQGVPLIVAVARGCAAEAIQFLVSMGADVNAATLYDVVEDRSRYLLIGIGTNLEDGVTPLLIAAGASVEHPTHQLDTIRTLLDAGADVSARTMTGRTALGEALKMTDYTQHQGKIGRRAPEEVLRQAAARSAQVVEMIRASGATE